MQNKGFELYNGFCFCFGNIELKQKNKIGRGLFQHWSFGRLTMRNQYHSHRVTNYGFSWHSSTRMTFCIGKWAQYFWERCKGDFYGPISGICPCSSDFPTGCCFEQVVFFFVFFCFFPHQFATQTCWNFFFWISLFSQQSSFFFFFLLKSHRRPTDLIFFCHFKGNHRNKFVLDFRFQNNSPRERISFCWPGLSGSHKTRWSLMKQKNPESIKLRKLESHRLFDVFGFCFQRTSMSRVWLCLFVCPVCLIIVSCSMLLIQHLHKFFF